MIPQPTVVRATDGSEVGVYEYGDPDGAAVLVFHGVPACGAGFAWADEGAQARRLRLVAPDRPGVGLSTARSDWTVGDYPAMVAALADALSIDEFRVWGYSGGGPYAVATAASLGGRVTALAVAAGMGEVGSWAAIDDFEKTDRQMLGLAAKHPGIARIVMGVSGRLARLSPKSALKSFDKQLVESDREALAAAGSPDEAMALFTQAFLKGSRGMVDDYRALGQPWGFDLGTIHVPTCVFQGDADSMVPLRHAQELVARIPGAELVVWPGAGHLGTVTHVEEILDWLAR